MLLLVMLTLTAVSPTRGLPTCPPGGSYFDEYTNRRECCVGICEFANDEKSREHCKLKCPGYDSETNFRAIGGHVNEAGSDPQPQPSTTPPHPPEGHDGDGGIEKGVIIGIAICVVVVAAVSGVVLAVVCFRRRRKGDGNDASPTKPTKPTKSTKSPIYKPVAKVDNSPS